MTEGGRGQGGWVAGPFLKGQVQRALIRSWHRLWHGGYPVGGRASMARAWLRAALPCVGACHVALFASLRGGGRCLGQGRRLIAPPDCGAPFMTCGARGAPPPPPCSSRSELGFKSTSRGTRGATQPLGG